MLLYVQQYDNEKGIFYAKLFNSKTIVVYNLFYDDQMIGKSSQGIMKYILMRTRKHKTLRLTSSLKRLYANFFYVLYHHLRFCLPQSYVMDNHISVK